MMFNMGSLRAAICASHTVNLVKFSNSVGTGGTSTGTAAGAGTQVPGTTVRSALDRWYLRIHTSM